MTIRSYLLIFGLVIILPLTALTGALLLYSASLEEERLSRRIVQLSKDLAQNIERDIERHITTLNTLATSPTLENGDFAGFHLRARRALNGDGYVVLSDRDMNQVVNTFVAFGEQPAKTGDPVTAQRVIETAAPQVSDKFTSLVTKGTVFNVDVPIIFDGQVKFVLAYGRPTEHLEKIIRGQFIGSSWRRSVVDRKGQILASTGQRNTTDFTGFATPLSTDTVAQLIDKGTANETYRAMSPVGDFGWFAVVDVPTSTIAEDQNYSLLFWLLTALLTLFSTVLVALIFARRISGELIALACHAKDLVADKAVAQTPSLVSEARTIRGALLDAQKELRLRSEKQNLLTRELHHRVRNILGLVQAIARRTLREDRTVAEARDVISKRINALASSQSLLVRSDWSELPFREIVDVELAAFKEQVTTHGPDVAINADHVLTFGLLLHELCTNAVKYGALSSEGGRVSITWTVEGVGANARFVLAWKEQCTFSVQPPTRRGFGTTLLENVFAETKSRHWVEYSISGLEFSMDVPLTKIGRTASQPPRASAA